MNNKKIVSHSILIIATFSVGLYGRKILNSIVDISFDSQILKILYGYLWWLIPVFITTGILYKFKNVIYELRLHKGFWIGLLFSIVIVFPMFIGSFIIGEFNSEISITSLIQKTFMAGFMEELLFRGFLFGLLFRKLKWGFIPASILGAVLFGFGHIYQGSSFGQVIGIFMITFMGAVWFAWLFIEWKENLWIPIWLHILMNLSWIWFDISDSGALGGYSANVFRVTTIVLSLIATVIYNKRKDRFRITRKNLLINKG